MRPNSRESWKVDASHMAIGWSSILDRISLFGLAGETEAEGKSGSQRSSMRFGRGEDKTLCCWGSDKAALSEDEENWNGAFCTSVGRTGKQKSLGSGYES